MKRLSLWYIEIDKGTPVKLNILKGRFGFSEHLEGPLRIQ